MGDLVTVSGKVNSMEEFIFFWYYDTVFRKNILMPITGKSELTKNVPETQFKFRNWTLLNFLGLVAYKR